MMGHLPRITGVGGSKWRVGSPEQELAVGVDGVSL